MTVWNIVDRRKKKYRYLQVDVIVEPTWHDNSCDDSDQAPKFEDERVSSDYDEWLGVSLERAIKRAMGLPYAVTMYIYDQGEATKEASYDDDQRRRSQSPTG